MLQNKEKELMRDFMPDRPEDVFEFFEKFDILMMRYDSAIREVKTKLEILNDELSLISSQSPISSIQSRRKKPISIAEKLTRLGKEVTLGSIMDNLNDVAGVRVICLSLIHI